MGKDIYLSLIIPVYNEEKRVHRAIEQLNEQLPRYKFSSEVVFIDDGSQDKTIDAIHSSKPNFSYRIETYSPNRGKGYAVKQGMLKSQGEYKLFMDADMSTPLQELDKFLPLMQQGEKVIIGTRKSKGANVIKRQHFIRQKMGEVFTWLSNQLTVPGVTDFTCGFKLFHFQAADVIFNRQQIERWGFDAEILFIAAKHNYSIKEVAVTWINDDRTKVNLIKDTWRSMSDLINIRINDLKGVYD